LWQSQDAENGQHLDCLIEEKVVWNSRRWFIFRHDNLR
jgi:hypothetical protein